MAGPQYGDAPAEQRGIVNARMWDLWDGGEDGNPYADIDQHFSESGMAAFISVEVLAFVRHGCNVSAERLNASACGVQPNWQSALSTAVRAARPQLASGAIVGLFLGDEVQCGGIPASNVSAVAALCRELLNKNGGASAKVWVNECTDPFLPAGATATEPDKLRRYPNSSLDPRQPCGGIPPALDLLSVDNYFSWSSNQASVPPSERRNPTFTEEAWVVRDFYRDYVIERLFPHQRLFVVPGLFGNDSTTPAGLQETIGNQMDARLEAYWAWLSGGWADDTTNSSAWVVGLAPFHWFQRGHETGASNYSKVLRRLRDIGRVVRNNAKRTPDLCGSDGCGVPAPLLSAVEVHVERGSTKVPLFPPSSPASAGAAPSMSLAGQVGECESGQVWLRSDAEMENLTAAVSRLESTEGVVAIEAEAWEVYQQGYVACRTAPPYTPSGGGYHPDPLLEIPAGGIARVPAGHAQPIFLTLCIPRDTKPGTYTGRVSLSALRPEFSASVNVTVEVWDIVIPTLRDGVFEGTWTFGEPNFTRECSKRSAWVVTTSDGRCFCCDQGSTATPRRTTTQHPPGTPLLRRSIRSTTAPPASAVPRCSTAGTPSSSGTEPSAIRTAGSAWGRSPSCSRTVAGRSSRR